MQIWQKGCDRVVFFDGLLLGGVLLVVFDLTPITVICSIDAMLSKRAPFHSLDGPLYGLNLFKLFHFLKKCRLPHTSSVRWTPTNFPRKSMPASIASNHFCNAKPTYQMCNPRRCWCTKIQIRHPHMKC